MRVYAFMAGKKSVVWTDKSNTAAEIVAYCSRFADRRFRQSEWFLGDLPIGATAFVETRLIIPPHNPKWWRVSKITHEFAARERCESNTLFIGVFSDEDYKREELAAAAFWIEQQKEICRCIAEMKPKAAETVYWEDLPPKLQLLCKGSNLSPQQCWIWRRARRPTWEDKLKGRIPAAPYRDFYARIRGPIPDGVILCHKCHDRRCMNPNHLEPGTHADNSRDRMERAAELRLIAQQNAQRNSALKAAWTPERLEKALALSKQGHSSKAIAAILGAGITSESVGSRLYYMKLKLKKAARRQAYLRSKERKQLTR